MPPEKVSDRELLAALTMIDDPVATSGEVAAIVGLDASQVRRRMPDLIDAGHVGTKKAGARARVYWLTKQGRMALYD
jgi:predicted ArsR family transcriptional regulator